MNTFFLSFALAFPDPVARHALEDRPVLLASADQCAAFTDARGPVNAGFIYSIYKVSYFDWELHYRLRVLRTAAKNVEAIG